MSAWHGLSYIYPIEEMSETDEEAGELLSLRRWTAGSGTQRWAFRIWLQSAPWTDPRVGRAKAAILTAGRRTPFLLPLPNAPGAPERLVVARDAPAGAGALHLRATGGDETVPAGSYAAFGTPRTVTGDRKIYQFQDQAVVRDALPGASGGMVAINPPLVHAVSAGDPVRMTGAEALMHAQHRVPPAVRSLPGGLVRLQLDVFEAL